MATAEEYGAWIAANPDKQGTQQFESVKRAYLEARAQDPAPLAKPTWGDLEAINGRTLAQNEEAARQGAIAAGPPVGDHPLAQDVPLRILHGGVVAPIQWAAAKLPAGLSYAASLGGNVPNPVSRYLDQEAQRVREQNDTDRAAYEQSIPQGAPDVYGQLGQTWVNPFLNEAVGVAGRVAIPPVLGAVRAVAKPVYRFFGGGASAARDAVLTQAQKYANGLAQKADKGVADVTGDVAAAAAEHDATVTKLNQQIADILDQRTTAQAAADKGISGQKATVDALSKQLEAYQNTLHELEQAAVPTQNMGTPGLRTPTGEAAISAVTAQREAITAARDEADAAIRPVVKTIVAEGERSGKAVADLPSAQALLKQSKDYLSAPPADAGRVAERAASPLTGIHQKIVDAIETQSMELTAAEAAEAKAAGQVVRTEAAGQPTYTVTVPSRRGASAQEIPAKSAKEATELARQTGGKVNEGPPSEVKYYRDFENSYEALDNLARHLGDSFQKGMEGFGGVPIKLMRAKNAELQSVLTEYVDQLPGGKGLRQQLQDNWAQYSRELEAHDAGIGKAFGNPEINAAGAIDEVARGGAGGLRAYLEKTDSPEAAYKVAEQIIKRELYLPHKPMDLATAQRAMGDTNLRDMVEALPDILGPRGAELKDKVARYMDHLAEKQAFAESALGAQAAIKATEGDVKSAHAMADALEKDAAKGAEVSAAEEAKIVDKALPKAEKAHLDEQGRLAEKMDSALAAKALIGQLQSDLRNDVIRPEDILKKSEAVFERMVQEGEGKGGIGQDEYVSLKKMVNEADTLLKRKTLVHTWLKRLAVVAAVGTGVGMGGDRLIGPTVNLITGGQ